MSLEIAKQDYFKDIMSLTSDMSVVGPYNNERLAVLRNLANRIHTVTETHTYITDMSYDAFVAMATKFLQSKGYITQSIMGGLSKALGGVRYGETVDNAMFTLSSAKRVSLTIHGSQFSADEVKEWGDSSFTTKFRKVATAKGIDRDGDLITKTSMVSFNTQSRSTIPSFYPWLSVTPEEYFDAFMASDEPVLIMFGPPGTGKSSFIRHLLEHTNSNALLAYNRDVVSSPAVIDSFYEGDYDVLVYEDLDDQLGKRENGNQLMPTILNGVDGVLKQNRRKKIIFSTNLTSANSIDDALKRLGRCFDIMYFGEVTREEAVQICTDMGRPVKDFSSKEKWSLAEITAKHSSAQQVVNRFGRNTGFK